MAALTRGRHSNRFNVFRQRKLGDWRDRTMAIVGSQLLDHFETESGIGLLDRRSEAGQVVLRASSGRAYAFEVLRTAAEAALYSACDTVNASSPAIRRLRPRHAGEPLREGEVG